MEVGGVADATPKVTDAQEEEEVQVADEAAEADETSGTGENGGGAGVRNAGGNTSGSPPSQGAAAP